MKRAEVIAFLKEQFIGDLEAKLDESLQSSSDEQLSALYKALVAEDPTARDAAQKMLAAQQGPAPPKIDMSKLKKPGSGSSGGGGGSDGEQVW